MFNTTALTTALAGITETVVVHFRHGDTLAGTLSRPTYSGDDQDLATAYLLTEHPSGRVTLLDLAGVEAIEVRG